MKKSKALQPNKILYGGLLIFAVVLGLLFLVSSDASSARVEKLLANPKSGTAPLTVGFSARRAADTNAEDYKVNFGDGASAQMSGVDRICEPGDKKCFKSINMITAHTYEEKGRYTAELVRTVYNECEPQPGIDCPLWHSREEVVDTVKVRVKRNAFGL